MKLIGNTKNQAGRINGGKFTQRLLSLLLLLVMLFDASPVAVLAESMGNPADPVTTESAESSESMLAVDVSEAKKIEITLPQVLTHESTDYSMEGALQMLLSDLISQYAALGIEMPEITLPDVESVAFTGDHAVTVQQVSGMISYNNVQDTDVGEKDFLLTSMEPFTSEEQFTLALKNGAAFAIGTADKFVAAEGSVGSSGDVRATVAFDVSAGLPASITLTAEAVKDEEQYRDAALSMVEEAFANLQIAQAEAPLLRSMAMPMRKGAHSLNMASPDAAAPETSSEPETIKRRETRLAGVFNFTILDGDTPLQPEAPVTVTVEVDEPIPENSTVYAVHFTDGGVAESPIPATVKDGTMVSFPASGFSVYVIAYTVEFTCIDTIGKLQINLENLAGSVGESLRVVRENDQYVTVLNVAGMLAESSVPESEDDADAAPCKVMLLNCTAKEAFDSEFWANAAAKSSADGVEVTEGSIRLTGDVELATVAFTTEGAVLTVEIAHYTQPAVPVVPETTDGFAYRFTEETANAADILAANEIVSSYYKVLSVSDESLVVLGEDGVLTAQDYFDELLLTLSLSPYDDTEVQIRLTNPAPAEYTYRAKEENVLLSDVFAALKITAEIESIESSTEKIVISSTKADAAASTEDGEKKETEKTETEETKKDETKTEETKTEKAEAEVITLVISGDGDLLLTAKDGQKLVIHIIAPAPAVKSEVEATAAGAKAITIAFDEKAGLPATAVLTAQAVTDDNAAFAQYKDLALSLAQSTFEQAELKKAQAAPVQMRGGLRMMKSAAPLMATQALTDDSGEAKGEADSAENAAVSAQGAVNSAITKSTTQTKVAGVFELTLQDTAFEEGDNELQPKEAVTVSLELDQTLPADSTVYAIHFYTDEDGEPQQDAIPASAQSSTEGGTLVSFPAEGFSVYAITYTVGLYSGGYTHHLMVGQSIALSKLFSLFNIVPSSAVESVSFSDPELMTVEALENDWLLTCLDHFDPSVSQTLTVTLLNGEVYTINVADAGITQQYVAADGETYEINIKFGADAQLPVDAVLSVEEIGPEHKDYQDCLKRAYLAANGITDITDELLAETEVPEDSYARFFDISIMNGEEKVQPQANVTVSIKLADAPEDGDMKVVHFDEANGLVVMQAESSDEASESVNVLFRTDSFSVYAVLKYGSSSHLSENLSGQSFKMHVGDRYVASNHLYNNQPQQIGKVKNGADAPAWTFESAGTPDQYYIYTIVNNEKKYINMWRSEGQGENQANAWPGNNPNQRFTVKRVNGNYYNIYTILDEKPYYLNEWQGNTDGNGFCGYKDPTSLMLDAIDVIEDRKQYVTMVKYGEDYYVIDRDGSLTKTLSYDPATNTITAEDPMLWTVEGPSYDRHIYFHTEAVAFDGNQLATDFYRRYLDPSVSNAITEENATNMASYISNGHIDRSQSSQIWNQTQLKTIDDWVFSGDWNGNNHLGVVVENGVPVRVCGLQDGANGVPVYFAETTKVPVAGGRNHSVNHIDIGISGDSSVTVPLAFGTYYYEDENGKMQEYTITSTTSVDLSLKNVVITPEDMKHATIKAYDINNNELHDVFDVTGYSSNAHTENSTVQVRIEGNFKVANLDYTVPADRWINDYSFTDANGVYHEVKQDRLDNKITYVVSATKNLTFPIKDDAHGQLYEQMADGSYRALSINLDVDMTASFNYFDQRNECPPLQAYNNRYSEYTRETGEGARSDNYLLWQSGGFPWDVNTGMDFVLGGNAEKANADIVAIEITKLIVDENGQLIKPAEKIVNNMIIHEAPGTNGTSGIANGVMNLNLEQYTEDYGYYGQFDNQPKHNKAIAVGNSGVGLVYDYSVRPGLVYVEEDKNTLTPTFKDVDDTNWYYKQTYITTEYVRRGGANMPYDDKAQYPDPMHYSKTYTTSDAHYNSIPEVLGYFQLPDGYDPTQYPNGTKKSGFVEFFVYNVYENDHTKLEVEKNWELPNGEELPADTEVTLELYYAKRVHGTEGAWSEEYDNPEIYQPVKGAPGFKQSLNTSLTLKANADEAKNWKGVFTDLPTTITVGNETYEVHYFAKETAVKVNGVDVTDHYQASIVRTASSDPKMDGKVAVTNKKGDLEILKKWYDKNGNPYTPAGSDNNVVITAELWKRGTEDLDPVTVTIRARTTTASDPNPEYSELWSSQVKSGSSVQFSVGAQGTSELNGRYTITGGTQLIKLDNQRDVIYNTGRNKRDANIFELSNITADTTVDITFPETIIKDNGEVKTIVGKDGIGYCIVGINEGLPYDAKVPENDPVNQVDGIVNGVITLNSANGWHISIPAGKMNPRYYYYINADTVRESGTGGRYAFAGPIIDMDSDGNKIISFENKLLKEYVSLDVEKLWEPSAPENAEVTVELVFATRAKGSSMAWPELSRYLPVKGNSLFELDEINTELKLNASNNWKGTIGDLPKYVNNEADEVDYQVREIKVMVDGVDVTGRYTNTGNVTVAKVAPEGNNAISNGTAKVTNTNETVTVRVNKLWQPDPPEGASVTVQLHRYAKKTKGSVILTLNSDKGAPIRGAVFELYKNGEPYTHNGVSRYTTDANGQISITGLDVGDYKLQQYSTPEGYSGTVAESFSVTETTANQTHQITLTNNAIGARGVFTLTLLDKVTHLPVQGASFKLLKGNADYNTSLTTNANGTITVDNLDTGVYEFVETAPATDYKTAELASGNSATFEVQAAHGNQSGSVTMLCEKQAKGKVTLTLTNTSGQPVPGAVFSLSDGTPHTTDPDGQIVVENLPAGTYSFTQTAVPSGNQYDLYTGDMSFIVPDNGRWDNEATINVTEPPKTGNVTIRLWRKQGTDSEWNWEEFVGSRGIKMVPGNTYSFTVEIDASLYPDHIWYYSEESSADFTGDSGHHFTGALTPLSSAGGTWNNGTYTFTFTPQTDNKVYNLTLVTDWDSGKISSFYCNGVVPTRSAGRSRMLAAPMMKSSRQIVMSTTPVTHTNASPSTAPDGYMDDSTFEPVEYTLSGSTWSHTFQAQDKYDADGNPYYYYVVETARTPEYYWIDSYTGDNLSQDGTITITNKTEAQLTITKTVSGLPTTVNATFTFTVTGGGLTNEITRTLNWPNDFTNGTHSITLTQADGIRPDQMYTVTESLTGADVIGYTRTTSVNSDSIFTQEGNTAPNGTVASNGSISFTNNYEVVKTQVKVRKVWNDADNQDGKRPASVSIQLKADGSNYGGTVTLDASNNWTYTWSGLVKYNNGSLISYTVEEVGVDSNNKITFNGAEYTVAITSDKDETQATAETNYVVTNSHTPETTSIPVSKTWVFNNPSGVEHADGWPTGVTVTVTLHKSVGGATASATDHTLSLSASNKSGTFSDLPKYENGQPVAYSVVETGITGVDSDKFTVDIVVDNQTGAITITNTEKKGDLTITKTMVGPSLEDLTAAQKAAITFTVTGPNSYSREIALSDFDSGSYTIENLSLGAYTVVENNAATNAPEGYTFVSTQYVTANTEATAGTATVIEGNTPATVVVTNNYTKDTSYTPKVTKVLNQGGAVAYVSKWPASGFDFTLTVTSNPENGATLGNNTVTVTSSSNNYTESFGAVTFTKAGTYTFTITETVPDDASNGSVTWQQATEEQKTVGGFAKNGITYNNTPITLTVVVELDEPDHPNELKITSVLYSTDETASTTADTIAAAAGTITNTYDVTPTTYAPKITKTFSGTWPEGGFGFTLAESDSNPTGATLPDPLTASATSANTTATFGYITFNAEGTYSFTITETVPANAVNASGTAYSAANPQTGLFVKDGIAYDATPVPVQVIVGDNNLGVLSVTSVSYNGGTAVIGVDIATAAGSITNIGLTSIHAKKVWTQDNVEMTGWPTGKEVTFQLQRNDGTEGNETWVPVTENALGTSISGVTVDSDATVSFTNLPNDEQYRIVETAVGDTTLTGENVIVATGTDYGTVEEPLTITNIIEPTTVTVTKRWLKSDGTTAANPPAGTEITLGLYKGAEQETLVSSIKLNGIPEVAESPSDTQETYPNGNADNNCESEAWTATWTNLPVYEAEDGSVITYVVKETTGASGYTVSYGEAGATYVSTGGTITNTLNETDIRIVKVVQGSTEPLSGALFTLEKQLLVTETNSDTGTTTTTETWPTYSIGTGYVNPKTTENDGTLQFTNLIDGTYRLVETQAPAGYNAQTQAIEFSISGGVVSYTAGSSSVSYESSTNTFTVPNTPGVELPSTGGPGTVLYTATGLTLLLGAALWLFLRRKREQN